MIDRMMFNTLPQASTSSNTELPPPFSPTSNYPSGGAAVIGRNTEQNTQASPAAPPPSHATGRPWGDNRSADEILKSNPALSNFYYTEYPKGYLEALYQKVGDFASNNPDPNARADAMHNLSQVIGYITSGTDSRASDKSRQLISDGYQVGYPPNKNSNYELFENFRQNGYSALKDPAIDSNKDQKTDATEHNTEAKTPDKASDGKKTEAPPTATSGTSNADAKRTELNTDVAPIGPTGRPEGDNRSADEILKENTTIVNSRPSSIPDKALIALVGDFTPNNPDPNSRADAAYNLVRLLHYTDSVTTEHAHITLMVGSEAQYEYKNNGKIDGEFQSPLPPPIDETSIFPGSEAAILYRAVTEGSYSVLPADKSDYSEETKKAYPGVNDMKQYENNYKVNI